MNSDFTDEKNKNIKDLSPQEQLSVAQEYTSLLKEILHDEKYKNY